MTLSEKRHFIAGLCDNVRDEILEKAAKMPDDWNGIELRQYIADQYASVVLKGTMSPARKRSFNNVVLVENL